MPETRTITLALTGASGMPYGMRLLECLLKSGLSVYLLYSQAAQIVAQQEMGMGTIARDNKGQTLPRRKPWSVPNAATRFIRRQSGWGSCTIGWGGG